jgi:predicted transcriptional regulator
MAKRRFYKVKEAIRLHKQGMNNAEVGKLLGASNGVIAYHLSKAGIKSYPLSFAGCKIKPTEELKEKLYNLYINERLSAREIAPIVGLNSKTSVFDYLKRFNIPRRDSIEATLLSMEKRFGYPVNRLGDRFTNAFGYVLVKMPEHPRANCSGYVFEHILIWEKANQKQLPEGWQIHHLNGVKNDNRPENLLALPFRQHRLVIKELLKHISRLEAENKKLRDANQLKLKGE